MSSYLLVIDMVPMQVILSPLQKHGELKQFVFPTLLSSQLEFLVHAESSKQDFSF